MQGRSWVWILGMFLTSACGRTIDGSPLTGGSCIPGQQIACACFNGAQGAQVCAANGNGYETCECDASASGNGSSTIGNSNTTTGSGGASGGVTISVPGSGGLGNASSGGGADQVATGDCTASALSFDIVDAEYSPALEAIVAISSSPPALHVLDPSTVKDQAVPLPASPVAVSVSPDGKQAAVAYDAFVSLIDLTVPSLLKTVATTCDAFDVVLGGNNFAYVFPNTDQWVDIHSVDFTTGTDHGQSNSVNIYEKTHAKLHPNGKSMYGSTGQLDPSDLEEYDVSQGVATTKVGVGEGPDFGEHEACGEVWMSLDGERVFSACGNVFNASLNAAQDLTYAGRIVSTATVSSYAASLLSVADSQNGNVYTIEGATQTGFDEPPSTSNDGVLNVFDYQYLSFQTTLPVPCIETTTGKHVPHARWVFASSDGSKLWVVLNVGAGTTWGVVGINAQ
jgi:chitinase